MKNVFLFQNRTLLKSTTLYQFFLISSLFFLGSHLAELRAQQDPVLSIQGILKKANGEAVADGNYDITFKLYENAETGQPVWTEEQMDVEVISGIYSTVLGNGEPLDIPFDTIYYLGVTVGSTEMKPRIQLTSAPYALALIGESNRFPSSGLVKADLIEVKGSVLARAGIPGANGSNQSGYAFMANNGKKDSGLFSTPTSGNVSLYVANSEKLKATADSVVVKEDLRLSKGSGINYDGTDDWRLVYVEDFKNGANGWQWYAPSPPENLGWNNGTAGGTPIVAGQNNNFAGRYIIPGDGNAAGNPWENRRVLKKEYNLNGMSYDFIKIKFKYYVLDTWDNGAEADRAWAAIAETNTGTQLRVGWTVEEKTWVMYGGHLPTAAWNAATNFGGGASSDYTRDAEMTFFKNTNSPNSFWLMFGAALTSDAPEENYGVGMIEIWVK